jgi:hypothetical protein
MRLDSRGPASCQLRACEARPFPVRPGVGAELATALTNHPGSKRSHHHAIRIVVDDQGPNVVPAPRIEAARAKPANAKCAHVAERHRRGDWARSIASPARSCIGSGIAIPNSCAVGS